VGSAPVEVMNFGMIHSLHLVVCHDYGRKGGLGRRSDCRVGRFRGRDGCIDVGGAREVNQDLQGFFFGGGSGDLPNAHRLDENG
jgi:hypothetical protein